MGLRRWRQRRRDDADRMVLNAVKPGHDWGVGIMRATGLHSGRVYPALDRLLERGAVLAEAEAVPEGEDRPPRKLYHPAPRTRRTSPPLTPP